MAAGTAILQNTEEHEAISFLFDPVMTARFHITGWSEQEPAYHGLWISNRSVANTMGKLNYSWCLVDVGY